MSLVDEYPATAILGLVGLVLGLLLPSGLDYFSNGQWLNPNDPQATITAAVVMVPLAVFTEAFSGLMGMLILGLIGFIIDSSNGGMRR